MADVLAGLKQGLGDRLRGEEAGSPRQVRAAVSSVDLPEAARLLSREMGGRLATVTGLDTGACIELLYHFCFDAQATVLTLRTTVDRRAPHIGSITPFLPGAEWIEREIHDLLGVLFDGHPRPGRLILADDWPEGVYPLRKDGPQ